MFKDKILKASAAKLQPITVPEWDDVTVYARKLSIREVNDLHNNQLDGNLMFLCDLVAAAITDQDGSKLFTSEEAAGLEFEAVQYVAEAVMKFNNMTKEAVDDEKKD